MLKTVNHFFFFLILAVLSTVYHLCHAQNGYTYPRPEGGIAQPIRPVGPAAGFPTYPSQTQPARPVPIYPQADTPTGPGYPQPGGFPGSATGIGRPIAPTARPVFPVRPSGSGSIPGTGIGQFGTGGGSGSGGQYEGGDYSAIPGQPGIDYPVYADIPRTNFDCNQQQYPGYYSDVEAQCQVFHVCALNKTYDFLCPNGTIFSQETLVCVWWNQYDCGSAPALYPNNAFIYDYTQTGRPPAAGSFGQTIPTTFPGQFPGQTTRPVTAPRPRPPSAPSAGYPVTGSGPQAPVAFPGSSTGTGGAFPAINPSGPGASGFASTVRPSFPAIQGDTAFPVTPISTATPTADRGYLPPRRA